ncbi:MAG: hypothetical protein G01um101470_986 [Parcubacteria group bacterium Gr01-1014_70]|nr:MAG: hypothetical protein G01um101470_986 [Parcubacteria group bacterium Gr01-1014_70]
MFPGTYMVRVIVSSGKYSASDDLRVTVGKNMVLVSEVMPGGAGWVEFQNSGSKPIHMGGWIVETSESRFSIPLGTTIASGSFAVLSTMTTHLVLKETGDHLHLFYPNGTYANGITYVFNVPPGKSMSNNSGVGVFTEPTPGENNKIENQASSSLIVPAVSLTKNATTPISQKQQKRARAEILEPPTGVITEEAIKASTSQPASLATAPTFSKVHRETFWFGGSLILGGLAAVGTVLFRRRKIETG